MPVPATAHTCHVCGDHRVSVARLILDEVERTDLHPATAAPTLRRVCRVVSMSSGESSHEWTHYVDDIEVDRTYWTTRLDDRRRMRRALVCN